MVLRMLVLGLMALNALMWIWGQGWLDPVLPSPQQASAQNPERLGRQIRPESIGIVGVDSAASAAENAEAAAAAASATSAASAAASAP